MLKIKRKMKNDKEKKHVSDSPKTVTLKNNKDQKK
jgi:hypothetical protein